MLEKLEFICACRCILSKYTLLELVDNAKTHDGFTWNIIRSFFYIANACLPLVAKESSDGFVLLKLKFYIYSLCR